MKNTIFEFLRALGVKVLIQGPNLLFNYRNFVGFREYF